MKEYTYCETVAVYRWHIRELTETGRHLGGGADSLTLCGLKAAWDLPYEVKTRPYTNLCKMCRKRFEEGANEGHN